MLKSEKQENCFKDSISESDYTDQYSEKYGSCLWFFQTCNFPYGRGFYVFDDKLWLSMAENFKNKTKKKPFFSNKLPWTTTNFNSDHMQSVLLRNPERRVCPATSNPTSCPWEETDMVTTALKKYRNASHP